MAVMLSGRPYMDCSAGLAKLWMALRAQVLQKKNEKHSHTEGSLRKAMGCSGLAAPAPPLAWCTQAPGGSPGASRFHPRRATPPGATTPPHGRAVRHEPVAVAMPAINTGAVAQPR